MSNETLRYDDAIVRKFVTATIVWGAVGMLVGLWCALQLALPALNLGEGRLRVIAARAAVSSGSRLIASRSAISASPNWPAQVRL